MDEWSHPIVLCECKCLSMSCTQCSLDWSSAVKETQVIMFVFLTHRHGASAHFTGKSFLFFKHIIWIRALNTYFLDEIIFILTYWNINNMWDRLATSFLNVFSRNGISWICSQGVIDHKSALVYSVRHLPITQTSGDQVLRCGMASLCHNELTPTFYTISAEGNCSNFIFAYSCFLQR